ncbi:hypothetical protein IJ00_09960 [Calothrix sp. 336/3]|nr:hypothetical protein IJ00_09960 [Calothrix sp. 336/3]
MLKDFVKLNWSIVIPILHEDATKTLPFSLPRGKVPEADRGKIQLGNIAQLRKEMILPIFPHLRTTYLHFCGNIILVSFSLHLPSC